MSAIEYRVDAVVTVDAFIGLLRESGLAERRPVADRACIEGMLRNSNLVVSAWVDAQLIGIARSMTDFHYACYLSDLAVHRQFQRAGVGRQLQARTQDRLGPRCTLILIAAPAAHSYYERIGFTHNERCWVLDRAQRLIE